jgi:cyclic beta-1,2-glucan synthetase
MLTQAGSGYSTCDGIDVTRWREDATSDCWGQYFYIRDLDGGGAWSAGRQPLGGDPDDYEAMLGSDRAVFQRRDADIETRYEIAVAADADAEVRRITLTNHGVLPRTLDVSSYAEVSTAAPISPSGLRCFSWRPSSSPPARCCVAAAARADQQLIGPGTFGGPRKPTPMSEWSI